MEPMKKPEWFELTESDGPKPRPHLKSGFRTLALSIPLLAITVGVVAAQTSNESPAIAETESIAIASAAPSVTQSVTPTTVNETHFQEITEKKSEVVNEIAGNKVEVEPVDVNTVDVVKKKRKKSKRVIYF